MVSIQLTARRFNTNCCFDTHASVIGSENNYLQFYHCYTCCTYVTPLPHPDYYSGNAAYDWKYVVTFYKHFVGHN